MHPILFGESWSSSSSSSSTSSFSWLLSHFLSYSMILAESLYSAQRERERERESERGGERLKARTKCASSLSVSRAFASRVRSGTRCSSSLPSPEVHLPPSSFPRFIQDADRSTRDMHLPTSVCEDSPSPRIDTYTHTHIEKNTKTNLFVSGGPQVVCWKRFECL